MKGCEDDEFGIWAGRGGPPAPELRCGVDTELEGDVMVSGPLLVLAPRGGAAVDGLAAWDAPTGMADADEDLARSCSSCSLVEARYWEAACCCKRSRA